MGGLAQPDLAGVGAVIVLRGPKIFSALGRECESCLASEPMRYGWGEASVLARPLIERSAAWLPEAVAAAQGVAVEEARLPRGATALYVPPARVILVSPLLRGYERFVALFHENAHAAHAHDATHADVWALTLALIHPPQQVVRALLCGGAPVAAMDLWDGRGPKWAAILRARYLGARRAA